MGYFLAPKRLPKEIQMTPHLAQSDIMAVSVSTFWHFWTLWVIPAKENDAKVFSGSLDPGKYLCVILCSGLSKFYPRVFLKKTNLGDFGALLSTGLIPLV